MRVCKVSNMIDIDVEHLTIRIRSESLREFNYLEVYNPNMNSVFMIFRQCAPPLFSCLRPMRRRTRPGFDVLAVWHASFETVQSDRISYEYIAF